MKRPPDDRLLASYLSGECSAEELREMELWLQSNPEAHETMNDLAKVWRPEKRRLHLWDTSRLWMKIRDRSGVQQVPLPAKSRFPFPATTRQTRLALVMASVLLTVSIGLFSYLVTTELNPDWTSIALTVQNGTRERLILDDGTIITLDAGSSFSYPNQFTAATREVSLYGEGYFEVAPDASKPFIVRTDHAVVQVLGTKFSVRSWELDRAVRVAVAEGRVALRPARTSENEAVIIAGGQVAAVRENGTIQAPQDADLSKYLGWLDHNLGFDNASLEEILFHLERWYAVKFVLTGPILTEERLSLHTKQKSIESIMEMINLLTDLNYKIDDRTVHLFASE